LSTAPDAALLRGLQGLLATIYDAPAAHDVYDFLVTDAARAAALAGRAQPPETDEQLLLAEGDDGLELSLYLDAEVLRRLAAHCPLRALDELNLADYCTALEGVSHFHYVVWNADRAREISLLELELQAEVDKYVTTALLCARQRAGRVPRELHRRLFEDVRFDSALDELGLERYRSANVYASMYCTALRDLYLRRPGREGMIPELRRFYRLGQSAKINRIHVHRHARRVS